MRQRPILVVAAAFALAGCGGDNSCSITTACAPSLTCVAGHCVSGSGPSCSAGGGGQGACDAGSLDCGAQTCCPANLPYLCGSNCYASSAAAIADCGSCLTCGGGGGQSTPGCHLGTTFVQNAAPGGGCPSNLECPDTDPLGQNMLPFCAQPNMQCCCAGGGLAWRCWGCGLDEACGTGQQVGECC